MGGGSGTSAGGEVSWMRDKCRRRGELDKGHVDEEEEEVRWMRDMSLMR